MGCDWRNRREDEADLARLLARLRSPGPAGPAGDAEFLFECEGGLVCGAGAAPPLYLWGLPHGPGDVRAAGAVQRRLVEARAAGPGEAPAPAFAHPAWGAPAVRRRLVVRDPTTAPPAPPPCPPSPRAIVTRSGKISS